MLLGGVHRVCLARVDKEGNACLLELLQVLRCLDLGRVGDSSDLEHTVEGEIEDVPCTETITGCAEFSYALLLEASDNFVEQRAGFVNSVARKPSLQIKLETEK